MTIAIPTPKKLAMFHDKLTKDVTCNNSGWFSVSNVAENEIQVGLQQSNWLMRQISLMKTYSDKGQAIYLNDGSLRTGRAGTGERFYKALTVDGTDYNLSETDSSCSISYAQISALLNISGGADFDEKLRRYFYQSVSLDMLRIGFNGSAVGTVTDPTANPNGEDVNEGWHTIAGQFNSGSQIITEPFTLGEGGDYPNIDALANSLIRTKIKEGFRDDPRIVVLVGAELAAYERQKLFNSTTEATELEAGQKMMSSIAGHFAFIPPFMPGKRLAVTTLDNLCIYTNEFRRMRAEFSQDRKGYELGYLRGEGYGLSDGYLYAASDENAITLM